MFKYLRRRVIQAIPTFFGVTILSYLVILSAPGDPVAMNYVFAEVRSSHDRSYAASAGLGSTTAASICLLAGRQRLDDDRLRRRWNRRNAGTASWPLARRSRQFHQTEATGDGLDRAAYTRHAPSDSNGAGTGLSDWRYSRCAGGRLSSHLGRSGDSDRLGGGQCGACILARPATDYLIRRPA